MNLEELWSQHKTLVLAAGGITAGAILYSFLHRSSSSSGTSTATTFNPSSGSTVSPTQYLVPYTGYYGPNAGTPNNGSTSGAGPTGTSTGTPSSSIPNNPPASTQQTAPSSSQYGFGNVSVGGTQYTLLGVESGSGPQGYSGYNVSGGAPVYFLAPGQQTPTQGTSQAVQGAQVLVPSIYDPNISATANHPVS